jgi:preprotein translocase subunit SecY
VSPVAGERHHLSDLKRAADRRPFAGTRVIRAVRRGVRHACGFHEGGRYDGGTKEFMSRTLFLAAAVIVVVAIIIVVVVVYRMTRRDPPGSYDAKPMHPGFRSNRGRGR